MSIQTAYNEWSEIYDTNVNRTRDLDGEIVQRRIGSATFAAVLEIGCGTGKNTKLLSTVAKQVHALDFSEGMITRAREKVSAPNVVFAVADLTCPWSMCPDSHYDAIICSLVLEHIENLDFVFAEAARVLRPGGRFMINELHPFKQYGGTQARFERKGEIVQVVAFVHHVSEYLREAKRQGLELETLEEFWHNDDAGKPPRLLSLEFRRSAEG